MNAVSLTLAFLAGTVATVNPCGFALLPAFLSYYVGTEEARLPASGRLGQGLIVGLAVTASFLAVFALVGAPISLGATALVAAVPWATIVIGAALLGLGIAQLTGIHLALPFHADVTVRQDRKLGTFLLFGVAYAISSLSCTLPVFLSVVGSSLATAGPLAAMGVFLTYGAGMGVVVLALSVGAALLRGGLAAALRRLLPYVGRISALLLMVVGAYLIVYWGSVLSAPAGITGSPVVAAGDRISAVLEGWLSGASGLYIVAAALALVLIAVILTCLRRYASSAPARRNQEINE